MSPCTWDFAYGGAGCISCDSGGAISPGRHFHWYHSWIQRFQTNRGNKPLSTIWKTPSFLRNPQQWWSGVEVLTCMWGRFSEMWRLSVRRIIFTSNQILLHFCISRYHLCISIWWRTLKTYHTTVFVLQSVVTGGTWIMKWEFS